jgi:hypothetical protein
MGAAEGQTFCLFFCLLGISEPGTDRVPRSGGFQNAAIGNRNRGINQTADAYRDDVTGLQNTAASKSVSSSQQYESDMKVAIDRQANEQIAGVNAGVGQAIGGYQRGAAQARSGVDQNYRLERGANKQIYVNQVDAAGQMRERDWKPLNFGKLAVAQGSAEEAQRPVVVEP